MLSQEARDVSCTMGRGCETRMPLVGLVLGLLVLSVVGKDVVFERQGRTFGSNGLVAKFHDGLNLAGSFLGIDTSKGVANLVSTSLLASKQSWLRTRETGVFTGFFRLLGFDATKLTAIALNGLIFIAQLISSNVGPISSKLRDEDELEEKTEPPSGSPLSWLFDIKNSKLASLVAQAKSRSLADDIVATVASASPRSACVVLLACKGAPLVRAMQRALSATSGERPHDAAWAKTPPARRMFAYLPTREQFVANGNACDEKYPGCDY